MNRNAMVGPGPARREGVKTQRRFAAGVLFLLVAALASYLAVWGAAPAPRTQVVKKVLDNGLTVLVKPNPANEVVAVKLMLRMGPYYEPDSQRGVSLLMQKVLTRGTRDRDANRIDREIESVGASIAAGLEGDDYGSVSLRTTRAEFDRTFPVLLDIARHPVFPAAELEKERRMTLERLAASGDQPSSQAYYNYKKLFYEDHPYGATPADYLRILPNLTRDDLIAWHRKVFVPNNMVFSIVGNVDADRAAAAIETVFSPIPPGTALAPTAAPLAGGDRERAIRQARESKTGFILLGFPAPELRSDDGPAVTVLNWILGGSGMGSRLFTRLRDERGLAYSVSTEYLRNEGPSNLFAFMATAPANLETAQAGLLAEFNRIKEEPVSEAELASAKRALRGSYLMRHETNAAQADLMGAYELLGLGYDYDSRYPELIDRVTAADLQRVAQKYFKHYTLSVLGPGRNEESLWEKGTNR